MAQGDTFEVQVLTPEGAVFAGQVRQLSTRTKVGELGVLARHAPVLARLRPTEMRLHVSEGEVRRFAQGEGWLQVFANTAKVLVGECVEPDSLDPADLRERLSDAERRISESEEDSAARQTAELDRERAEVFLRVAGSDSPQ